MIGDSSNYFWSGISSSIHGDDIGFFLPLTSAVSAMGYQTFGLQYAPRIIAFLYFSILPIMYFLARKTNFSSLESYIFIIILQAIPLSIWFSKAIYSEPIWQLLILMLIYNVYSIIQSRTLPKIQLLILFLILLLSGFTRGSAVILYGFMISIILYDFWYHGNFKRSLILVCGMFILTLSIHYTAIMRTRYLLEWQYSRVIAGITITQLMAILYAIPIVFMLLLSFLNIIKVKFMKINFPLFATLFAIICKLSIILYISINKKHELLDNFYLNELEFAIGNFGIIATVFICIGIVYIYYLATKGNILAFIFIFIYTLFFIPFVMQNVFFSKEHIQILYWNRYYFSEIFIIHIFAILYTLKFFSYFLEKLTLKKLYQSWLIISIFPILMLVSINKSLYTIVTNDGYLTHSSEIFTWIEKKLKNKKVSMLYSDDISYNHFDIKHLLHKGLYVLGVRVKAYQKVDSHKLNTSLRLKRNIMQNDFLLCISTHPCNLNTGKFTFLDVYSTSIKWKTHPKHISQVKNEQVEITIRLYKINH